MFAVPGWSVSSSTLATQEDPRASFKVKGSEGPDGNPTVKTSVKRKRGHNQPAASAVTGDNLVELWEKVIEGKKGPAGSAGAHGESSHKPKEKRKRKTKTEGDDVNASKEKDNGSESTSKEKFEHRKTLKQKRREKKLQLQASGDAPPERPKALPPAPPAAATKHDTAKLTPLQASMRQKLTAARFRHLNQTLYTTPSSHSVQLFQDSPEMFEEYHEGFRRQVEIWPENPVDGYVRTLQIRGQSNTGHRPHKGKKDRHPSTSTPETSSSEPLPRTDGICTVADLGCGDAGLARSLSPLKKKLKLDVLSYDLQAKPPHVTAADIAALPLADGAVNVAIFCLALMGTNWLDFIDEAYRILHWRGELWIAEIKSRFGRASSTTRVVHSVGNRQNKSKASAKAAAEADSLDNDAALAIEVDGHLPAGSQQQTDVSAFVAVLKRRGFALASTPEQGESAAVDMHNKMFVTMRFIKAVAPSRGKNVPKRGEMGYVDEERGKSVGKKAKFIDDGTKRGEEVTEEEEGRVLKPCVYKLR